MSKLSLSMIIAGFFTILIGSLDADKWNISSLLKWILKF